MGFYTCLGLAVMSKGLIGLVFPTMTVGVFLLLAHDLAFLRRMRMATGVLVFLAITVPWHAAVGLTNPGFFHNYFVNEHVYRFLNRHFPKDFRSIPVWQFWLIHFGGLFPWVFFVPAARRYWPGSYRAMNKDQKVLVFAGLWAASVLLFFSVSARLEHYGLPAYPALALIAGLVVARGEGAPRKTTLSRAVVPVLLAGTAAVVLAAIFLTTPIANGAASFMDEHDKLTFFSAIDGVSGTTVRHLRPEVITVVAGLLLTGLAGFIGLRRSRVLPASLGMGLGMAVVFLAVQLALQQFEPYLSMKQLALTINREWRSDDMVAVEGEFFNTSSIGFYTRKPVYRWRGHPEWEFGSRFRNAGRLFLDDAELRRIWTSRHRVFLVADRNFLRSTGLMDHYVLLGVSGTNELISNMPSPPGSARP
jgi:4-amino-4-deoxy-L-arabinose transferase-like glycosyltransferase